MKLIFFLALINITLRGSLGWQYQLTNSVLLVTAGNGGFFLAFEDLGEMFDSSFPAYAFFFLQWRFARAN